jgi:hypothetical protein
MININRAELEIDIVLTLGSYNIIGLDVFNKDKKCIGWVKSVNFEDSDTETTVMSGKEVPLTIPIITLVLTDYETIKEIITNDSITLDFFIKLTSSIKKIEHTITIQKDSTIDYK